MNVLDFLELLRRHSFVFVAALAGCGSDNQNVMLKIPEVSGQRTREVEQGQLGIVGGTAMTSASPLTKYMRAVRHRFQTTGISGTTTSTGGDRFCAGVAVAKNAVLTAAHCVELLNNVGDFVYVGFNDASTLPRGFPARRLFMGDKATSHYLPLFPSTTRNYSTIPTYGSVSTSVDVSQGTPLRSADVGFVYDWVNSSAAIAPLCTELPAVGNVVTVTGLKVTYNAAANPAGYYLGWAEYLAKVIQVSDRPTEYPVLTSSMPAVWSSSSPMFSKTSTSTAMEFVSEGLDPAKDCAEGGDSGGGVFLTRADGSKCLLGVNSARGSQTNLGSSVACTPTIHRRVLPEMISALPVTQQTVFQQDSLVNKYDAGRRTGEWTNRIGNYPAGTFVGVP